MAASVAQRLTVPSPIVADQMKKAMQMIRTSAMTASGIQSQSRRPRRSGNGPGSDIFQSSPAAASLAVADMSTGGGIQAGGAPERSFDGFDPSGGYTAVDSTGVGGACGGVA